jgi:hypothetical protein
MFLHILPNNDWIRSERVVDWIIWFVQELLRLAQSCSHRENATKLTASIPQNN